MADQKPARRSRIGLITAIGVMLVAANLGFVGWMGGYFKTKEKIALVTWNQDPYWDLVVQGANDTAKELNVDLTVVQSTPDEKVQSQHLRDLLASGMQGIAVSPNNLVTQKDLLNELADKSVLVTFDSDAPIAKRTGFDETQAGVAAGPFIHPFYRTNIDAGTKPW